MNRKFHPTSVLLDKGTVRETLRGVVRAEVGLPLPPRQQAAYTAIQVRYQIDTVCVFNKT